MQVLYFAWMRERIGHATEQVDPGEAATARELIELLKPRSEGHALAFENLKSVRCAVDQEMGDLDMPIAGAREVAFFPPMTGG
ncbi:MAG: molybdopterin converting factor subunit 1 [Pseudomonadota bacterium]